MVISMIHDVICKGIRDHEEYHRTRCISSMPRVLRLTFKMYAQLSQRCQEYLATHAETNLNHLSSTRSTSHHFQENIHVGIQQASGIQSRKLGTS
jgi:hypothetical protein